MKDTLTPAAAETLETILLRCVECSTSYPGIEAGWAPRYRCQCGGVLDVEIRLPAGASHLRQLFDQRAATPPTWPLNTDTMLPDHSGVWRYRELILPVPAQFIISRPEGNTNLYPAGIENCGARRIGTALPETRRRKPNGQLQRSRYDCWCHHGFVARSAGCSLRFNRQHLCFTGFLCRPGRYARDSLLTRWQCLRRQVSSVISVWRNDNSGRW